MRSHARSLSVLVVELALLPCARASAQSIGPYTPPPAAEEKRLETPAPRVAEYGAIEDPLVVSPARLDALDRIEAMEAWNRSGREPLHVGFSRPLPAAIRAALSSDTSDPHSVRVLSTTGSIFWGTRITVQEAFGIRLHLSGVHLPPGTRFWSYGTEGSPVSFGLELVGRDGDLWTPISFGETAFLDVEVPGTGPPGGFSILEIAELRPRTTAAEPACAIDAICATPEMFSFVGQAMKAVAVLVFSSGSDTAQCTGTLLNDLAEDGVPYLLTANHCISTQASANSLTAYWDYHAPACGGVVPDLFSVPTSSGATLLANDTQSDFSFLRLNAVPPGRAFMGWNASSSAVPQNTTLFRVSCPNPAGTIPIQQQLAQYDAPFPTTGCLGTDFLASQLKLGYAFEGSSGSAAMLANGQVVGQLYGTCADIKDPCTVTSFTTQDGAFSLTYPSVAQWLSAPTQACVPSTTALCLNTRFKVTALWQKPDGTSGPGTAVSLTSDTGYFWFFDPSNVEVVTKVLDGCGVNGHYWVFSSGLTNVGVTLTFTDLSTGTPKSYQNPVGTAFPPTQDTTAFSTCP